MAFGANLCVIAKWQFLYSLVVGTMLGCVQAHGLGVEQADDQTQLVLQYNGAGQEQ